MAMPSFACRSASSLRTYRINGRKQWISNGSIADYCTILAATPEGPTWFVVAKDTPGFTAGTPEDKHGIRLSNTASLFLDDVEVPAGNLVGTRGGLGLVQAQQVFGYTRLMVAAFGLGGGWEALDRAIAYSTQREQGGGPLSEKQGFTHKLIVPHAVRLEAARAFMEDTADRLDRGLGDNGAMNTEGAIAKYMATEAGNAAADAAIQAHGGYGYTRPYVVEKIRRDVRITTIYEGTSEIMEMTIARGRWQEHLKSSGRYYVDVAAEMTALHARNPRVGADAAALAAQSLAVVLDCCRPAGSPATSTSCSGSASSSPRPRPPSCSPARPTGRWRAGASRSHRPGSPATPSPPCHGSSRAESAQQVALDGSRWVAGALEPDSPVLARLAGIPADAIRAAQAGLVADMDRVADVLYGRAPA